MALTRTPEVAVLHQALALWLVRRHDETAALAELRRAAALAPDDAEIRDLVTALRDRVAATKQ